MFGCLGYRDEMLMGSAFSPLPTATGNLQHNSAFPFHDLGVMPALPESFVPPPPAPAVPTSSATQGMLSPLNVQTDQVLTLASQLHALTVSNQRNNNLTSHDALLRESLEVLRGVYAPPSPPESLASSSSTDSISGTCGSPLEVSRSLRLPIFSKLSCSDDSD